MGLFWVNDKMPTAGDVPQSLICLPQRDERQGDQLCGLNEKCVVAKAQALRLQQEANDICCAANLRGGRERVLNVREQEVWLGAE